eukprot:3648463-Amphidinium_carterae.2
MFVFFCKGLAHDEVNKMQKKLLKLPAETDSAMEAIREQRKASREELQAVVKLVKALIAGDGHKEPLEALINAFKVLLVVDVQLSSGLHCWKLQWETEELKRN